MADNLYLELLGKDIAQRYVRIKSSIAAALREDDPDMSVLKDIEGLEPTVDEEGKDGILKQITKLQAAGGDLRTLAGLSLDDVKETIRPLYGFFVWDMLELAKLEEKPAHWGGLITTGFFEPMEESGRQRTTRIPSLHEIVEFFGSAEMLGFDAKEVNDIIQQAKDAEISYSVALFESAFNDFCDESDAGTSTPEMLTGDERTLGIFKMIDVLKDLGAWDQVNEDVRNILDNPGSIKFLNEEAKFQQDALFIVSRLEGLELEMFNGEKISRFSFVGLKTKNQEIKVGAIFHKIDALEYGELKGHDALQHYVKEYNPVTSDPVTDKLLNEWHLAGGSDDGFLDIMRRDSRPELFKETEAKARIKAVHARSLLIKRRIEDCWNYAVKSENDLPYDGPSLPETKPKPDAPGNNGAGGGGSGSEAKAYSIARRVSTGLDGASLNNSLVGGDDIHPPLAPRGRNPGRGGDHTLG